MNAIANKITRQLQPLVGLKLSIARRAADMRNFQFGSIRAVTNGTVGEYALHIQCPWRIEGPQGIVTGRSDLWEPAVITPDFDWETWNYDTSENLQDKHMRAWLGGYDPHTGSFINETDNLVVEAVQADAYGGAVITLSGGYRLVLFPDGTDGEDWRIFDPVTDDAHFVIEGGRIVPDT